MLKGKTCFEQGSALAEEISISSWKMPVTGASIRHIFLCKHSSSKGIFKITDMFSSLVDECG